MKEYGFLRLAAATPSCHVANPAENATAILAQYQTAAQAGAGLVVFPEMCLTGYTCGDLFQQSALLKGAVEGLGAIVEGGRELDALAVVGLPLAKDGALYNCAAVIQRGRVLGIVPKQNVPNYGEFYELRHFTPATADANGTISLLGQEVPFGTDLVFACGDMPAFTLGVEICEDLWAPCPPSTKLALGGATVIANLSASDEIIGKAAYRRSLLISQSARLLCTYVYADAGQGESTTDMVFAGHDLIAENGALLAESPLFHEGALYADTDLELLGHERIRSNTFRPGGSLRRIPFMLGKQDAPRLHYRKVSPHPFIPRDEAERAQRCAEILSIQARGLAKRAAHAHAKKLVVGISGGLDSCLALLVAVRALEALGRTPKDVLAVTMPCFGTTERTRRNAEVLCETLGVSFQCVDIGKAVTQHFHDIGQSFEKQDVTFENGQARERTQVLMDLANMEGGLVVGTGDLSELALGWATYNGDHMSMYGVNAGVPKTLVRHLVAHAADTTQSEALRTVLLDILDTPVSPELLPAKNGTISQVTEDLVGPYELHDFFLYHMVRYGAGPAKVFYLAKAAFAGEYAEDTIRKWLHTFLRRFFSQQFKRSCLPDGPKVGSVSLSPRGDWRMPSDAEAALWIKQMEAL
ncbi:MAG: NAD(+) synthase [Candidatus Pelethousia sp.]|nr:NAD(+) synthase [Candidatus Pelethousia sp.]